MLQQQLLVKDNSLKPAYDTNVEGIKFHLPLKLVFLGRLCSDNVK